MDDVRKDTSFVQVKRQFLEKKRGPSLVERMHTRISLTGEENKEIRITILKIGDQPHRQPVNTLLAFIKLGEEKYDRSCTILR